MWNIISYFIICSKCKEKQLSVCVDSNPYIKVTGCLWVCLSVGLSVCTKGSLEASSEKSVV